MTCSNNLYFDKNKRTSYFCLCFLSHDMATDGETTHCNQNGKSSLYSAVAIVLGRKDTASK